MWEEDLIAPGDEDRRFATDLVASLGAQREWLSANLPKRDTVIELNEYGKPKLPPDAIQIYGKAGKGDRTRRCVNPTDGRVQSIGCRLPDVRRQRQPEAKPMLIRLSPFGPR